MSLTYEQIEAFRTNGYLRVDNVFDDDDLAPVIAEIESWVDQKAKTLHQEGKIQHLFENEPFELRYGKLFSQSAAIGAGMDIMRMRGPEIFSFLRHPKLLGVMASLLGPEIACNPIQHLRAKTPAKAVRTEKGYGLQGDVPWHQDAAVTLEEADDSDIITLWMPLVDATIEMGCMEIIPRVHQGGYLRHQSEGGTTIVSELLPDTKPLPMPCKKRQHHSNG